MSIFPHIMLSVEKKLRKILTISHCFHLTSAISAQLIIILQIISIWNLIAIFFVDNFISIGNTARTCLECTKIICIYLPVAHFVSVSIQVGRKRSYRNNLVSLHFSKTNINSIMNLWGEARDETFTVNNLIHCWSRKKWDSNFIVSNVSSSLRKVFLRCWPSVCDIVTAFDLGQNAVSLCIPIPSVYITVPEYPYTDMH